MQLSISLHYSLSSLLDVMHPITQTIKRLGKNLTPLTTDSNFVRVVSATAFLFYKICDAQPSRGRRLRKRVIPSICENEKMSAVQTVVCFG